MQSCRNIFSCAPITFWGHITLPFTGMTETIIAPFMRKVKKERNCFLPAVMRAGFSRKNKQTTIVPRFLPKKIQRFCTFLCTNRSATIVNLKEKATFQTCYKCIATESHLYEDLRL